MEHTEHIVNQFEAISKYPMVTVNGEQNTANTNKAGKSAVVEVLILLNNRIFQKFHL